LQLFVVTDRNPVHIHSTNLHCLLLISQSAQFPILLSTHSSHLSTQSTWHFYLKDVLISRILDRTKKINYLHSAA